MSEYFLYKMAELRMADFKIAADHQVESEWMSEVFEWMLREDNKVSEFQDGNVWIQHGRVGRIQDGCHHQVESEWMSEVFLCKMAESRMADFNMAAIIKLSQNEWVKFFCAKWLNDGCHHQVESMNDFESDWISWVRVLSKMAESKMAVSESKMAEFKMVAIIKLKENDWVKFLLYKLDESKMA